MEGPIEFDVKAYVVPEDKDQASKWLENHLGYSPLEARKEIVFSIKNNEYVLLGNLLGWNEAQKIVNDTPVGFKNFTLVETSYSIGSFTKYCDKHKLHFCSVAECPVCTEWYLNTDKNGNKVKA